MFFDTLYKFYIDDVFIYKKNRDIKLVPTLLSKKIFMFFALFGQQIKTGNQFDSNSPNFTPYAEMVHMPTTFPNYDKSPVFEQFFSTSFVGRYVAILKIIDDECSDVKVLEFREVRVWVE